jgi:predicted RNA-binding Zn-ribbon protein involved in translation (DUF1610 family)
MIFPIIYAVGTWYLAMRWRRRWLSFAAVTISAGLLCWLGLAVRAGDLDWATAPGGVTGPLRLHVVEAFLWPYTALVFILGVFISCLRRTAPSEAHCPRCHYDLSALDPEGLICPECGAPQPFRCMACGCDFSGKNPVGLVCPDCSTIWRGPGARGVSATTNSPADEPLHEPADWAGPRSFEAFLNRG